MRRLIPIVVLLAAGCALPKGDTSACAPADVNDLVKLQQGITKKGTLRNGYEGTSNGLVLVSAELHMLRDKQDKNGEILTWVMSDGSFRSVDGYARDSSSFEKATFDVRAPGVYATRACVAAHRGAPESNNS